MSILLMETLPITAVGDIILISKTMDSENLLSVEQLLDNICNMHLSCDNCCVVWRIRCLSIVIAKGTKIEHLLLLHISMSLIFMHCQCNFLYIIIQSEIS